MGKVASFVCFVSLFMPAWAGVSESISAETELNAAIDILKSSHINSEKLDWPMVTARAEAMIAGADAAVGAYPAINYVIAQLGEKHTYLRTAAFTKAFNAGPGTASSYAKVIDEYSGLPTVKQLDRGITILTVPQFESTEKQDRAYVAVLREALIHARANRICRFVIDLRNNGGGNYFPMINGLTALLGKPPYGFWIVGSHPPLPWEFPNRPVEVWTPASPDYGEPIAAFPDVKVAVLVDRHTVSSGEFTAMAFEGLPNARIFGEPTAGFLTGNVVRSLPDGATLVVSTSRATDRLGKPYRVAIVPDKETEQGQPSVDAAVYWLKRQPCD